VRNYIFSDENNTESLQEFSDARSDIDITEELPHDDASTQPKTPSPTKEALLPTEPSTPTSSSTSQEKINLEVASITSTMQPAPITDLESVKKLLLGSNDSMKLFSDYSKNIQLQAQDISNLVENIMNMNKMNNESPPIPTVLSEQKTPPVKPEASKVTEAPVKAVLEKIATPPNAEIKSVDVEVVAKNSLPMKAPEANPATPEKTQKRQAPRPPDQVKKEVEVLHQPTPAEVKQKSPEVVPMPIKIEEKAPELPPKPQTPDVQNQTKSPELPPKPKSPVAATAEVKPKVSEVPKQKTPETDPKVAVPKASDLPAVEKPKTPEAVVQPKLQEAAKPKTPDPEPVASVSSPPKQQSPVQKNAAPEAPIAAEEVISLTPELKRKAPQPPKKEILETKEQPVEVKPAPQKTDAKEEVKPTTPKPRSPSPSDDSLGEDDLVSDKLNTLKRRPKGKIMTASGK
jgi:hypothetical protein